jgi:hypothetical protein
MKWISAIFFALVVSTLTSVCLAEDEAFQMKVESHLRQILKGDEGLSNPVAFDRLKKAMSEGGDWDSALIRLIDADRREPWLAELAINVLRLRGSYG